MSDQASAANGNGGFLGTVERIGNKLPDPAVLFIALLFIVWILSWLLSYVTFDVIDPRSGEALTIQNLLTGASFTEFLSVMVTNFSHFHPVGVVLVAMLGIGVAEHTGFINAAIRSLLNVTPASLLTPMVILVLLLVALILLGCLMDSLSMILLTIPIFFPVVSQLDFGLTPEQVADQLQAIKDSGKRVKGIYVIPNFQNPTGITTSQLHREALLELAESVGN